MFTRYASYVSYLKSLCLALFADVICAFTVSVPWKEVGWAIVSPPFSSGSVYLMAVIPSCVSINSRGGFPTRGEM